MEGSVGHRGQCLRSQIATSKQRIRRRQFPYSVGENPSSRPASEVSGQSAHHKNAHFYCLFRGSAPSLPWWHEFVEGAWQRASATAANV